MLSAVNFFYFFLDIIVTNLKHQINEKVVSDSGFTFCFAIVL